MTANKLSDFHGKIITDELIIEIEKLFSELEPFSSDYIKKRIDSLRKLIGKKLIIQGPLLWHEFVEEQNKKYKG